MFDKLSELLDSFLVESVPGYDCIVYHKGEEVFRRFGGYSSLEEKKPTDGKEQYFLYSCSKPITAVAGAICLEKGFFKLEDKISKYLPEFSEMCVIDGEEVRPAKTEITVKDLFCMTAGFGYDCNIPELKACVDELHGQATTREAIRYLARAPLLFDPGARWEYSFCLDVLVTLVEEVSGMRFDDFAKENIFIPLGMNSTTFRQPEETSRLAEQYLYHAETKTFTNIGKSLIDFSKIGKDYESGGAGCVSTAEDCIKFLEGIRTGEKVLKRETVELMTTNMLTPEQMKTYWMPGYGYGLGMKCSIGQENCADYGWGGLAGALMSVDPGNELSIFYVQHVIYAPNNTGRYLIPGLVYEALGLTNQPVKSKLEKENSYI